MAAPLVRCGCKDFVKLRTLSYARSVSGWTVIYTPAFQEDKASKRPEKDAPVSSVTGPEKTIVIPKRKQRDKLSVLKALASTVKQDFSAPNYGFFDDPFLTPVGMLGKRSSGLAKASGQKAARYVLEKYPTDFANNPALPNIEIFNPPTLPELEEGTEAGLLERIAMKKPVLAYQCYLQAKDKGVEISTAAKESLLELLCVYNSGDPSTALKPTELYYRQDITRVKRKDCTWRDQGSAEQLFKELESPSAAAYCSLIRGRAKYNQVRLAYDLFLEMREKGLKPDLQAYNALLHVWANISHQPRQRWLDLQVFLKEMHQANIEPNLDTFNSILYVLTRTTRDENCRSWVMQTLSEMKACGIEPSLASWYYVLAAFYHEDHQSDCDILHQIVDHLEGKELEGNEPTDFDFFTSAMAKCYLCLNDLDLAYRIDNLLNHSTNHRLLGDDHHAGVYYTAFLSLLCMFEQIETIMDQYERITPHVYCPTYTAYQDLLQALELNEGYQYLPKIWSDLTQFDYSRRTDLVEPLLAIVAKQKHEEPLQGLLVQITKSVKEKFESDSQDRRVLRPVELTGPMISSLAQTNLNADNLEEAWSFIEIFQNNKNRITGMISESCLMNLAEKCLKTKNVEKLMAILDILSRFSHPKLDELAGRVKSEIDVTDEQRNHIDDLL